MAHSIDWARSFVDNQTHDLHPLLRVENTLFDDKLQVYVPRNPEDPETRYKEEQLSHSARRCEEAMKAFKYRRLSPDSSKQMQNVYATWEDVIDEAIKAKGKWDDKARGTKGIHRRFGRSLGNKTAYFSPWLELLPSSDYGSLVCGGLKLVLGALTANLKTHDEVIECLEDLPDTIDSANKTLETYFDRMDPCQKNRLRIASLDLATSILETVQHIIHWFERRSYRKVPGLFLKQAEYSSEIRLSIASLKKRSMHLRVIANECLQEDGKTAAVGVTALQAGMENMSQNFIKWSCTMKTELLHLFRDEMKGIEWTRKIDELRAEVRALRSRANTPDQAAMQRIEVLTPTVTVLELMRFLNVDPNACQRAFSQASLQGFRDGPVATLLVQQLLQLPRFKVWLRANASDFLVLRRQSTNIMETANNFGFFAATLIESLQSSTEAVILHFFNPISGLQGAFQPCFILRNLIYQLLQFGTHASITSEDLCVQNFELNHLQALFRHILDSLDNGPMVIVIVHSLAYYDDRAEVEFVLQLLVQLSCPPSGSRSRVKVLLTPPTPMVIDNIVPRNNIIDVPDDHGHSREFAFGHRMQMFGRNEKI